ncbi:DinB family protein [Rubinisphaera italica]|uniref:DinB family protein n=1 Tax=Rubinisphaera italica TaxID=2527969 RepID=A0A5C5XG88_9PLAN|nr:DinB family protein [Rubinisphaera italica]TWT61411.1 DinB family protein [Rubinisphaera italica]
MTAIDLINRLHEHRMWVNRQLLLASEELTKEQLQQPFEIGQGSVWKTLLHMLAAEYVWLEALEGIETPLMPGDRPGLLPGNQETEERIRSIEELCLKWKEVDRRWITYLDGLTQANLDEIVYKVSTSSQKGKRSGTKRGDILLHVCTHAQYTTSQLVNMLKHLGRTPLPESMLISRPCITL